MPAAAMQVRQLLQWSHWSDQDPWATFCCRKHDCQGVQWKVEAAMCKRNAERWGRRLIQKRREKEFWPLTNCASERTASRLGQQNRSSGV